MRAYAQPLNFPGFSISLASLAFALQVQSVLGVVDETGRPQYAQSLRGPTGPSDAASLSRLIHQSTCTQQTTLEDDNSTSHVHVPRKLPDRGQTANWR